MCLYLLCFFPYMYATLSPLHTGAICCFQHVAFNLSPQCVSVSRARGGRHKLQEHLESLVWGQHIACNRELCVFQLKATNRSSVKRALALRFYEGLWPKLYFTAKRTDWTWIRRKMNGIGQKWNERWTEWTVEFSKWMMNWVWQKMTPFEFTERDGYQEMTG